VAAAPSGSSKQRQQQSQQQQQQQQHVRAVGVRSDESYEAQAICFVCSTPSPAYQSTNRYPVVAPTVAICGVTCEAEYLQSKGLHNNRKISPLQDARNYDMVLFPGF
jgi:hypothetical protein